MTTPFAGRPVTLRYAQQSQVASAPAGSQVLLALEPGRGTIGVRGRVREPGLFRDALMTALSIMGSDLRYKRRDRAAYLAYLAKQGKKATKEIWEAQKQFLDEAFGDEQHAQVSLDPILTVHPDEVSLEVFSKDESSYARLVFKNELFAERQAAHGTTFVSFPAAVTEALDRVRTYAPIDLDASTALHEAPAATTGPQDLQIPASWLRGFLQVQSAATLPAAEHELAAIDLYNLLFLLRMKKAKQPPRALRFELVPGAAPRMVLEPWEIVLPGHGAPYAGKVPAVVRTFGRQRLLALARLLPHVQRVRVRTTGAGLPVVWILEMGNATLTLALTGWTESGWSSAAAFDLLMPGDGARGLAERVHALFVERGPLTLAQVMAATSSLAPDAHAALQLECLRGRVLFDPASLTYRPRMLFAEPVDEHQIRYGNERELRAHRLLEQGEITITKIHEIAGEGVEIHGTIDDREAHRSFAPHFMLDLEGRVKDAACGCPTFRRGGLREGPCEHMIALRLVHTRRRAADEALRLTPEGRKLIRAETRTYVRRDAAGQEVVYRVSLDDRALSLQWGARAGEQRQQRLWFDSDSEARDAYFARLDHLAADGFIDADAAAG